MWSFPLNSSFNFFIPKRIFSILIDLYGLFIFLKKSPLTASILASMISKFEISSLTSLRYRRDEFVRRTIGLSGAIFFILFWTSLIFFANVGSPAPENVITSKYLSKNFLNSLIIKSVWTKTSLSNLYKFFCSFIEKGPNSQ